MSAEIDVYVEDEHTGRPTKADINLNNLAYNFKSVRNFIGEGVLIMSMVKANAYGHGAAACALRLATEGADWFGVATIEEAAVLRQAGIGQPVLCLGGFYAGQEEVGIEIGITPAIYSIEDAERLNRVATRLSERVRIHVKIDTGMGRVGVQWFEAEPFATRLAELSNLEVEGLMTHFAAADDPQENAFTNEQMARFAGVKDIFRRLGFSPSLVDMANSPGAVAHPRSRGNMVRLGGILYGLGGDVLPKGVPAPDLKPVLSLSSAIAQLKRIPAGTTIGYGRTFSAARDSLIATIPIGYHDGYRRGLSNCGRALVRGVMVPVVGRVSMDWTTLDVTDVPGVAIGDRAILIGSSNGQLILAEDIAAQLGTISYEVTCGISDRVMRHYIH